MKPYSKHSSNPCVWGYTYKVSRNGRDQHKIRPTGTCLRLRRMYKARARQYAWQMIRKILQTEE